MNRFHALTPALLAALSSAWVALPLHAQQQVNTGNALDANAQVGGGNVNPGAIVPDFRARNLLITGQVTDGRQFRGDVGYGAPGAFQGELGSDDLFRFRADSYGSTRQLPQVNALGNNTYSNNFNSGLAGGDVIYSGFYNPGVGEVNQPGTVRTVVNSDGTRSARVTQGASFNPEFVGSPRLSSTAVGLTPSDGSNDRPGTLGQTLGLSRDADGNFVRFDASPVFGLRETSLQPVGSIGSIGGDTDDDGDTRLNSQINDARFGAGFTPDVSRDPSNPLAAQNNLPAGRDRTNRDRTDNTANPNAPRGETLGSARDTRRTTGRLGENSNPLTSNSAVDPAAQRDPLTGLPASIQLGARLTPGLNNLPGRPTEAADQQDAQRVARLGEAIFRPLDTTAADSGDSAYLDRLAAIREQYRQGNRDAQAQGEAPDRQRRDPLAGPARPDWMEKLETPEDDLIQKAEQSGLTAIANILRAQRDDNLRANRGGAGNAANAPQDPEAAATNQAMNALIDQLSYDLPRLETLQGQREDRVNTNFQLAEAAMAKGQFFNATALYEQLAIDAPGNPLARVGLVHAQMGAGLIRSSALQLRRLFEDHPELIATRYAENLLPPEDRTVWLRNELQRAIDDPQQGNAEPALLLAYLGHQAESRQLVRYGLALAQEAKPLDPLLPLLRKVWLGENVDLDDAK